jgi:Clp amino terminal domain, pathogenicity island component
MLFDALSRRAKRVILEARLKAGARGADSIDVNDLIAALIVEDQDPNSLELNEQHPDVKRILEMERKPLGVLFRRECAIPREPFFSPNVATVLLTKLENMRPKSNAVAGGTGIPTSTEFDHAFEVARHLQTEFHQSKVEPMHVLAAALQDSCEAARLLKEAGITEENVLRRLRSTGANFR